MKTNEKPSKETFKEWHNDPSNWILGFLYFNKKDRRIFPPKRTKLGWTINFANPISIFVILSIIAILYFVPKYFK